ncbi:zinc/manganese transport system substrate-binding protein [Pullulanibacillus pueri]|uniref:Metal ABC transporter substrate-binding protein n=1 Tax=Pullulanibacillus pueri TaxID=1437324 RepID=A0A8J3A055_9BACL|nr:zinc ABC transporter substrate-binding protein [Pullulanibacillus pueri]MBM7683936.1 zinc/manganese transport system substrate-binding protein [Pullulanibacillus pueri]GGH87891.1 metal ABC transporter substrate-binding protein [Pullulanibacillus pueri]
MKKLSFLFVALILVLSIGVLSACSSSSNGEKDDTSKSNTSQEDTSSTKSDTSKQPINIVAAEDFYGEVAEAVGGDYVKVTSIIDKPSVDPHDFEPTANTSKTVNDAQLLIYNGIGYDNWMDKLISSSSEASDKTVIRVGDDLLNKKEGDNEHLWYMPDTMPTLASALADKLSELDPDHADYYKQQVEKYKETIQPLEDLVSKLKQKTPKKVETTEPVFDYMIQALNYEVDNEKFSMAIEEETDPAPADLAQMKNDLKNKKVAFFVQNTQVESPVVKQFSSLAKDNNIPIVEVTETLPEGKDYVQWMTDELKQVEKAQAK